MPLSDGRAGWEKVACGGEVPSGRIGHSVAVAQDRYVFLWGGVNEADDKTSQYLDDFYRYDFCSKRWTRIELTGAKPCGRAFHSAVMYNDRMLTFGGCNGRGRFNEIYAISFDGHCELIEATGTIPSTRYCHSAVVHEDSMLVFGGKCGGRNSNRRLDNMYKFDLKHHKWTQVDAAGEPPTSRSAHTAVVYHNKMLMFGGRNAAGKCCDDLYEFYLDTNTWRKIDRGPTGLFVRARHSIVLHHDKLVTFAGWNGRKKLNDLFVYSLDTQTFSTVHESDENDPRLPCRRECHTAVVVRSTMILFGGRFRGAFMNDNYEYELDVYSLKEHARAWLLRNEHLVNWQNRDLHGLPDNLMMYMSMYKHRALPFSEKKKLQENLLEDSRKRTRSLRELLCGTGATSHATSTATTTVTSSATVAPRTGCANRRLITTSKPVTADDDPYHSNSDGSEASESEFGRTTNKPATGAAAAPVSGSSLAK